MAAIVDGPRGGYWATALGLTGWGLAVVYLGEARPVDIDPAGATSRERASRASPPRC